METLLIILVILFLISTSTAVIFYIALRKAMQRNTFFENYFVMIANILVYVQENLAKVDKRGSFSSDDEIGFAFNSIKEVWRILIQAGIRTIDEKGNSGTPAESKFEFENGDKQVL